MIPVAQPHIGQKEKDYVIEAVESGWVSSAGAFIGRFEQGLSEYLDVPYVTTTSNGTTALHLALLGLGIRPGDEVIIPATSFIATMNAILYVGATPVFVDIELESWGIDPKKIEEKITTKTKAIIAVHLYGYSCAIEAVKSIADRHQIFLIEDNAESLGATASGKKLGTVGDVGTYSFFGNKIITTGEGGAISTRHKEVLEKMITYKNHGRLQGSHFDHEVIGYNYRMTNLQAALGVAQLEQIDEFIAQRKHVEDVYQHALGEFVFPQKEVPNTSHVNWFYSFRLPHHVSVETIMQGLKQEGIDTRRLFPPMNSMPYLSETYRSEQYPNAQELFKTGMSLPTYVGLEEKDLEHICTVFRSLMV
ncbi:MAG: DegT/DnrJ/EryC1/StrS aminotransferase family protein [Candidatus Magasanikbacteria bacterium]|nr:DegT/DnrJ/EryC1/StrS aminotransferase family protein [Candidatus Magasanikbacteria bacterium]